MRVAKGDQLVGMEVVEKDVDLLTVSEQGLGKRTKITDYPTHHRNVSGVKTANVTAKTGPLVTARAIRPDDKELLFCSEGGQVIKIETKDVPQLSRATQGVRLMKMGEGDTLATVATV
jgi:DNA gyrase subunit A